MKTISTALAAHIAGEVTTLATCLKLTRRDNTVFGFTDHDAPVMFEGVTYAPTSGFTPSAVASAASLAVDNVEIEGVLSSDVIREQDLRAGLYDFAEIDMFLINYQDTTQGTLHLKTGWMGEVTVRSGQFTAEVRGLSQRLSQTTGELFSASCRAQLGDNRCTVNLTAHTVTGTLTTIIHSAFDMVDSARTEPSGVFTFGLLTFTSGANAGLQMEVKEHAATAGVGGRFTLAMPMPYPMAIGDAYSLTKGCDKTLDTCFARFNNVVNFRGEPFVPGLDRALETAGTRSTW